MCLICFNLSTFQKSRKKFLAFSLFSLPLKHLFSYPWGRWLPLGFILFYFFLYFISYLVGSNSGNNSLVGLCHSLLQCLFILLLCIVYSMNLLNTHISYVYLTHIFQACGPFHILLSSAWNLPLTVFLNNCYLFF